MPRTRGTWTREQAIAARAAQVAARRQRAAIANDIARNAAAALASGQAPALNRVEELISTALDLLRHELGSLKGERLARVLVSLLEARIACRAPRSRGHGDAQPAQPRAGMAESPDAPATLG